MGFLGSATHHTPRHQKTMDERWQEKAVEMLLSIAEKDPRTMCVLINKYRQLNLHHDSEIANLKERLQAETDRKVEQVILKNRREELILIASNIIGRLLDIFNLKQIPEDTLGREQPEED